MASDSSTFFENNFCYGLTIKIWYDFEVFGAESQEDRWSEFLTYCKNYQDDKYNFKILKAFNVADVLPTAMLMYNRLPEDSIHKNENANDDVCKGTRVYPNCVIDGEEFKTWKELVFWKEWKKHYDKWITKQEGKDPIIRESIENAVKEFKIEPPWNKSKIGN